MKSPFLFCQCILLLRIAASFSPAACYTSSLTCRPFHRVGMKWLPSSRQPHLPQRSITIIHQSNSSSTGSEAMDADLNSGYATEEEDELQLATGSEQQDEEATVNEVPSYRTLIVFASTTILIWLSEPLLSLVDTTVVGLTQTDAVTQLASLGPATTLIDSLLYLTYFLAIATTNQLAPALATKDYRQLQETTSHVHGVAVILGILVTVFVFCLGPALLHQMAGSSATPQLVQFATRYSLIRASVAVSSVVGMVAQAFCLTIQDTKTCALAVLASSIVNIVGDVGLSHWGVQGAAVATGVAGLTSTGILLLRVRSKMIEWRKQQVLEATDMEQELDTIESASDLTNATKIELVEVELGSVNTTEYALTANVQEIPSELPPATHDQVPFLSLPDRTSFLQLCKLAGPIFFVILAKIACYGAMTLRCTDFGVVPLAAHNIMMRIFFFYGCFGDAISQSAQTFLPATLYPKPSQTNFRLILKRLVTLAAVVGVANSQASVWILRNLGGYLTRDTQIVQLMRDHTFFFGLSLFLHPFILCCEGIVIASRDFGNLVAAYAVTLGLHFGILKFFSGSFPAVWRTFFLFQFVRIANFVVRVWIQQRAIRKEEKAMAAQQAASTT